MLSIGHRILFVPVQISRFVYANELTKPFSIFLYLKLVAGDKVHCDAFVLAKLRSDLKMSDPKDRTFRKHLKRLIDLNWIGFNPKSGIYHIRSFDHIRAVNDFRQRRATKINLKDIKQMQSYLVGVIINNEIHSQRFYWEIVKRKTRTAAQKRDVANQSKSSFHPSKPSYYGICNRSIAELLNCKNTRACILKNEAAQNGYIKIAHRYYDFAVLEKADYHLRATLAQSNPAIAKRLKFWRQIINGKKVVKVVLQQHDEITPLLEYKRVAGFSQLDVPFTYVKGKFITKTPISQAA